MSEAKLSLDEPVTRQESATRKTPPNGKPPWETPRMEDVSEEVMAQPYIRFT